MVVIDEAQNLSATALEEMRLLCCDRRDTQPPFSLLLVGDEQLLPRLQMGINAPLLARLSFCLRLELWTADQLCGYVQARLEQVGIHANPFEAPALALLLQAGNGLPRLLNHLAQRALEEAVAQNSRTVTAARVQCALELLPWVAQLAKMNGAPSHYLSNLLQLDRFEEDLNISRVRLTTPAPIAPKPVVVVPRCSPAEQEHRRQRALEQLRELKEKLHQGLAERRTEARFDAGHLPPWRGSPGRSDQRRGGPVDRGGETGSGQSQS